ncbi:hypothetical protein Tsubulata_051185 [Turnera subulata]|uniref:CAP-Gly domain-containing linker protein 1-like n=1 Tax=Turnera subulata TaxID=218843 RepID=A0A9Q0G467_9ROSI|nr:hypothetical protein Tsubulata_033215 [Turnera subulata]KAJ4841867.1 hypothetical protein Tsubulata_051185 [Turnera subulata]
MANSDSSVPPLPTTAPLVPRKENLTPVGSKIAELTESRTELLNRIQGLKQDLQNWRSKLDTQVKIYREELSDLKKSLNVEVDQLRSEFQELKSTLQQQQEDVTASLKNLGLQGNPGEDSDQIPTPKINGKDEEPQEVSTAEDTSVKSEE